MNSQKIAHYLLFAFALIGVAGCGRFGATADYNGSYDLNPSGEALNLNIVSWNILSTADLLASFRGFPLWNQRRNDAFTFLRNSRPDVLAIQELAQDQLDEFKTEFTEWQFVAAPQITTDSAIAFDRTRFELVESGAWNLPSNIVRRVAVWARLRAKVELREVLVVSVHIDATNSLAGRSVERLREKLEPYRQSGAPLILAGDFNLEPSDPLFQQFIDDGWQDISSGLLLEGDDNTYPTNGPEQKIDHILAYSNNVQALSYLVGKEAGSLSDHFPVQAQIVFDHQ